MKIAKKNSVPTLVSFFHGVGGMSKGAERAGFKTLYATDHWDIAEKAFKLNNCNGHFDNCDVKDVTFERIRENIRKHSKGKLVINKGDVDCVVSGSPCQGMSSVNTNRTFFDSRNMLMIKQIHLAGMQGLNAKVAWFEQVPGFLDEPMRPLRLEVLAALRAQTDYTFELRVLNALDYGAFQSRNRVTIIMVRKDVGSPSFPKPQPIFLSKVSLQSILPYITAFKYGKDGTPKSADCNYINTMTATDDGLMVSDGKSWRNVSVEERLILSHLKGYNLNGFTETEQVKLLGNMVQIPFAEAVTGHIKSKILGIN